MRQRSMLLIVMAGFMVLACNAEAAWTVERIDESLYALAYPSIALDAMMEIFHSLHHGI